MISATSEETIFPNAVPTMTPTARSTTLPFTAKFRNSSMKEVIRSVAQASRSRLFRCLCEGAERARTHADADAANLLCLEVDLEFPLTCDIRMASRISGTCSASGYGANSAHN